MGQTSFQPSNGGLRKPGTAAPGKAESEKAKSAFADGTIFRNNHKPWVRVRNGQTPNAAKDYFSRTTKAQRRRPREGRQQMEIYRRQRESAFVHRIHRKWRKGFRPPAL